ncbi:hypothetical protein BD560DRAFT_80385 [Blakeslea trispora]|nr:hypothetical protein BD560DRAFT_80385 [Blakeslea trispora]
MKLEPVQPLLPAGKTQIHASASTPLQFDAEAYIKRFMSLTKAGAGQCAQMPVQQAIPSIKKIVYPLPHFKTIPSIPLLLTAPQVEVIDTMRGKCQSATIASIFDCFSFHPTEERDKSSSKLLFVVNFLNNIRTSDFVRITLFVSFLYFSLSLSLSPFSGPTYFIYDNVDCAPFLLNKKKRRKTRPVHQKRCIIDVNQTFNTLKTNLLFYVFGGY